MVVSSKIVSDAEDETILKVQGSIEGQVRIRAQIALAKYNLASISPHRKTFDKKIVAFLKEELALLWNGYEDYLNDAEDAG